MNVSDGYNFIKECIATVNITNSHPDLQLTPFLINPIEIELLVGLKYPPVSIPKLQFFDKD